MIKHKKLLINRIQKIFTQKQKISIHVYKKCEMLYT